MPDISKIQLPSGGVYQIKDAVAREAISGGVSFIIAWDGSSTPVPGNIPAGVVVTYNGTTYTGTLSAETTGDEPHAQAGAFYLVKSQTQAGSTLDAYDEYVPVGVTGAKVWEKIGDTQIDLTDVVTGVSLTKQTDNVLGEATTFTAGSSSVSFTGRTTDVALGEATTFALTSGAVTHGALTGHTDTVLGTGSTFSVTEPTITVTPTTTYIKASASGTAVGANGTANAITGFGTHTTDTFVKSVTAETNKKLDTTTVPNVTGNTQVTANKSTWTFTMGSGDASETLIIGGGNGSDVTATNTTLGTAKTVATGTTSTTGTGDAIVTGVTIGDSAAAITALGTPTTAAALTGVKVTTQPTITLATDTTSATGRVSVATGISSASASGTAVSASGDNVTAIISMPTSTVGTGITVGTNDKVTAVTNVGTGTAAAQTITVGTNDKVTVLKDTTDVSVTKGNA